MPRRPRAETAPGTHHVVCRGNRRQALYFDLLDRDRYLSLLEEVVARYRWRCLAYCLMTNHLHLVIETAEPNLGRGMHRLNSIYAQWFNWRWNLDGHLFQDRFGSRLVYSEWHMLELVRYVVLNPVRAGLCPSPGDWPWSSYAATTGRTSQPAFLATAEVLEYFGQPGAGSVAVFEEFVRDGLRRNRD